MHFVQIRDPHSAGQVAVVEGNHLRLLANFTTTYALAQAAIVAASSAATSAGSSIDALAAQNLSGQTLPYDEVYEGRSAWKLGVPFDHPRDPAHCLVAGTGLTHKTSASNRAKMHQSQPSVITDSMRMYQWGLEGGAPVAGSVGVQPEWFYKGNGSVLRAHGEPLTVPAFGDDGGEEPEVAGAYLIGPDGTPFRVGFVIGNEFSDHVMERKNYLYLAPSKLRECAIGPELVTAADFRSIHGEVSIERAGETFWSAKIYSGEAHMSHTLANLEHHHFKYPGHRYPGDVHIHFYGADAFSFGEGVALAEGDTMVVAWPGLGRALRNPLRIETKPEPVVHVRNLQK